MKSSIAEPVRYSMLLLRSCTARGTAPNQPVERARGTVGVGVEVGDRAAHRQRSPHRGMTNR